MTWLPWHDYAVAAGLVPLAGTEGWFEWIKGNRRDEKPAEPQQQTLPLADRTEP